MSADPISCSWKALKLNTANCAQGRGKMQVSFSHVGTGGARKTPPLSLGTWPTEGEGYSAFHEHEIGSALISYEC